MDSVKDTGWFVLRRSHETTAERRATLRKKRIEGKIQSMKRTCAGFPEIKIENCSSMNAVKSGLFSLSPVIKTKYYEESEEDFKKLLEGLESSYDPQGEYEKALVMDLACHLFQARRGELFENAAVKHNAEKQIKQAADALGISALQENVQAAQERVAARKRDLGELSQIPEDIAHAAESDFVRYRGPLKIVFNFLWENAELATKMTLERGWKLGRFHIALKHAFNGAPVELYRYIVETKRREVVTLQTELSRLDTELKKKQKELEGIMSEEASRCVVPQKDDLESLDRFYSMHGRKSARLFDQLAKAQWMRINGSQLTIVKGIRGNGSGRIAAGADSSVQVPTVAPVNQQGAPEEGEKHVEG